MHFVCAAVATVVTVGCTQVTPEVAARKAEVCGAHEDGSPMSAPELVARGSALRDAALREPELAGIYLGEVKLIAASDCYSRALQLNPDSYEANLGLGVALIGRARMREEYMPTRAPYITAAKRAFGRAYMARQGPYEVVYYLAELAVLEHDYSRATSFLDALVKAKAKLGPAYALLGYIAEKQGRRADAQRDYEQALEAGSSGATLEYVTQRIPEVR